MKWHNNLQLEVREGSLASQLLLLDEETSLLFTHLEFVYELRQVEGGETEEYWLVQWSFTNFLDVIESVQTGDGSSWEEDIYLVARAKSPQYLLGLLPHNP